MDQEPKPKPKPKMESLPIQMRAPFQSFLIIKILGKKEFESMTKDEQNAKTLELFDMYAGKISAIIDDTDNKEIRDLIIAGEYEEASVLVINILYPKKLAKAA